MATGANMDCGFWYEYRRDHTAILARAWEAYLTKQGFGGHKAYIVARRRAAKGKPVPA